MALEIRSTPVLEGESAVRFLKKARQVKEGSKKDFSKHIKVVRDFLKKSNI